jgi:hypothetical protein
VPFAAAASNAQFQRPPAQQAPSKLIRSTRIAENELASQNRFVRFQAIHVGVHAGRRPAEHIGMRRTCADAVVGTSHPQHRRLMPAVGAYARPFVVRSRKAAAAIRRVDFRRRVLVVQTSKTLLAV